MDIVVLIIKRKKVKNGTYKVVKIIAEFSFLKEE